MGTYEAKHVTPSGGIYKTIEGSDFRDTFLSVIHYLEYNNPDKEKVEFGLPRDLPLKYSNHVATVLRMYSVSEGVEVTYYISV